MPGGRLREFRTSSNQLSRARLARQLMSPTLNKLCSSLQSYPGNVAYAESIGRVTLRRADHGQNGRSVFYVSCGHYNTKIVVVRSPAASDTHTLSYAASYF